MLALFLSSVFARAAVPVGAVPVPAPAPVYRIEFKLADPSGHVFESSSLLVQAGLNGSTEMKDSEGARERLLILVTADGSDVTFAHEISRAHAVTVPARETHIPLANGHGEHTDTLDLDGRPITRTITVDRR